MVQLSEYLVCNIFERNWKQKDPEQLPTIAIYMYV